MLDLDSKYTREAALADGVLIDVTEEARSVGILAPTFMSAGLWNSPNVERSPDRVSAILDSRPLRHEIAHRMFGRYIEPVIAKCFPSLFYVYVFLEPSPEFGVLVTVLDVGEKLRYDAPRTGAGGSFYVM